MRWIEFAVYTTQAGIEHVAGALTAMDIDQLSIEESAECIRAYLDTLSQYWDYADANELAAKEGPCVKAYIADIDENIPVLNKAREAIKRLSSVAPEIGALSIVETTVDDEDWANSYKRYFKPIPIGEQLLVLPPWEDIKACERTRLIIDPGMAFGTGEHHSTRLCLELLESNVKKGDSILDIGCGSGILSIAAILLGAKNAVCVDIDAAATKASRDNAAANGIAQERISTFTGNILNDAQLQAKIQGKYDMVFANIVADVIIALCPMIPQYLKDGGSFICSGIIEEREVDVKQAMARAGLTVRQTRTSKGGRAQAPETPWVAIMC